MEMEANQHNAPYDRVLDERDEDLSIYGQPLSKDMRIIRQQWRESKPYWEKVYKVARRDKRYVQGKQWDKVIESERIKQGLATLTVPLIRTYANHQIGQSLPASVDLKAFSVDPSEDNTTKGAEALRGHIKYIDRQSKSEIHRHKARKDQLTGGIGWLNCDYVASESAMEGEIKTSSPRHFDTVYIDPYYNEPDASDANYSFELKRMPYSVAVARYGRKVKSIVRGDGIVSEFEDFEQCASEVSTLDGNYIDDWIHEATNEVTIAVHHWRRKTNQVIYVFDDVEYTEEQWKAKKQDLGDALVEYDKPERVEVGTWRCQQRTLCGWSVIDKKQYYISRIPWTPIFGYTVEDGRNYTYHSIVHDGVEIQENINWLASQAAKKIGDAKTIAFVEHGLYNDSMKPLIEVGNTAIYGKDSSSDLSGGSNMDIIPISDNGQFELGQLNVNIELLREVMSTSNDKNGSQVINSAQQLALTISDRDAMREEMDINYRNALELHYSKVIEMIKSVYSESEHVRILKMDDQDEEVGIAQLTEHSSFKYSIDVKLSPTSAMQKQQAQQVASMLIATGDEDRVSHGIMMAIESSELSNKPSIVRKLHASNFLKGKLQDIPIELQQELAKEAQENGQIQQMLQQQAQQLAQEEVQKLLQESAIQAQMAQSQALVASSEMNVQTKQLGVEQAQINAEKVIGQADYQARQQQDKTDQENMKTLQQFMDLQEKIAENERLGLELDASLIQEFLQINQTLNQVSSAL